MSPTPDAPRFGRVITAMVTPFDDAGRLDIQAAADLARWLAAHGSDGLVLSGSTGESSVLTDEEKADLWRAVAEAVTIPVIAGTGSNDTEHSIRTTKLAATCGVDGLLAVTPYYNRPSQAGIEAHFRAMAEAGGGLPMVLYDIPVRSGRRIGHSTDAPPGPRGAGHRRSEGRRRRPGRDGPSGGPGAGRLRDLQRRRRDDPSAAGRRRRRGHQRGRPLGRPAVPGRGGRLPAR